MGKKSGRKITYSQKDRRTLSEIRKLTSTGTNRPIVHEINRMLNKKTEFVRTELADMYEKTEKGINDIKTGIYSLERQQKNIDQKLTTSNQKLEKIEKDTDQTGKVQGIFDFTFALVTITFALLYFPLETDLSWKIGLSFVILGLTTFILLAIKLKVKRNITKPKNKIMAKIYYLKYKIINFDIRKITILQIILSTSALILYLVIVKNGV